MQIPFQSAHNHEPTISKWSMSSLISPMIMVSTVHLHTLVFQGHSSPNGGFAIVELLEPGQRNNPNPDTIVLGNPQPTDPVWAKRFNIPCGSSRRCCSENDNDQVVRGFPYLHCDFHNKLLNYQVVYSLAGQPRFHPSDNETNSLSQLKMLKSYHHHHFWLVPIFYHVSKLFVEHFLFWLFYIPMSNRIFVVVPSSDRLKMEKYVMTLVSQYFW